MTRRAGRLIAVAVLAVCFIPGCAPSADEPASAWTLVWSDEFDGPAGQSPDSTKWRFDIGTDWGNAQLEYDTDRPENVSLDGEGNLRIAARQEEYKGRAYTSGRINTYQRFDQAYGKYEARIRLPIGQGLWPAFWMLAANFEQVPWPDCGEIDILEYLGNEPRKMHGSLHGPGYAGGDAVTGSTAIDDADGLPGDFHVFGIEWDEGTITWLLDDAPYQTFTPADLPEGAQWVFDHPHFLILNVAVGGHWPGPPDDDTSFPQTMLVDWVRVHSRTP